MKDVMKAVAMNLLFGDNFPESKRVISEDPEYLEVLDEMKLLFKQMRKDFSEKDYDKIAELVALQALAEGYQHLEYFHSGLTTGFEVRDRIIREEMVTEIRDLIS